MAGPWGWFSDIFQATEQGRNSKTDMASSDQGAAAKPQEHGGGARFGPSANTKPRKRPPINAKGARADRMSRVQDRMSRVQDMLTFRKSKRPARRVTRFAEDFLCACKPGSLPTVRRKSSVADPRRKSRMNSVTDMLDERKNSIIQCSSKKHSLRAAFRGSVVDDGTDEALLKRLSRLSKGQKLGDKWGDEDDSDEDNDLPQQARDAAESWRARHEEDGEEDYDYVDPISCRYLRAPGRLPRQTWTMIAIAAVCWEAIFTPWALSFMDESVTETPFDHPEMIAPLLAPSAMAIFDIIYGLVSGHDIGLTVEWGFGANLQRYVMDYPYVAFWDAAAIIPWWYVLPGVSRWTHLLRVLRVIKVENLRCTSTTNATLRSSSSITLAIGALYFMLALHMAACLINALATRDEDLADVETESKWHNYLRSIFSAIALFLSAPNTGGLTLSSIPALIVGCILSTQPASAKLLLPPTFHEPSQDQLWRAPTPSSLSMISASSHRPCTVCDLSSAVSQCSSGRPSRRCSSVRSRFRSNALRPRANVSKSTCSSLWRTWRFESSMTRHVRAFCNATTTLGASTETDSGSMKTTSWIVSARLSLRSALRTLSST